MRKLYLLLLIPLFFITGCEKPEVVISCDDDPTQDKCLVELPECNYEMDQIYGAIIPITNMEIQTLTDDDNSSYIDYQLEKLIRTCNDEYKESILLHKGSISPKLTFELEYTAPIGSVIINNLSVNGIKEISIATSINGDKFTTIVENISVPQNEDSFTIDLENTQAKNIRITVTDIYSEEKIFGLSDIKFTLGEGYLVIEDETWNSMLRYNTLWSGADGIFSFNVSGEDYIGAPSENTYFIFSDTFIASETIDDPESNIRAAARMINNSMALLEGTQPIKDKIEFIWGDVFEGKIVSLFEPTNYQGLAPTNLITGNALSNDFDPTASITDTAQGKMWLSSLEDTNPELIFDLFDITNLGTLYIWNYNDADTSTLGMKNFELYYSLDQENWIFIDNYTLTQASGTVDLSIDLTGINAKYIKIVSDGSNFDEDNTQVGLGQVLFTDATDFHINVDVVASSFDDTLSYYEGTRRLWLQDGVVVNDALYIFAINIVDHPTDWFVVDDTVMIKIPLVNDLLDYNNITYHTTPLMYKSETRGDILFGAGILNLSENSGYEIADGYIYIYGYETIPLDKGLVVARVKPEDIENFNNYEYYTDEGWSKDISNISILTHYVSAELSVHYETEGFNAGKFVLTVMENTMGGYVSFAYSDTPYGTFSEYDKLYFAQPENGEGSFVYNAKAHPHLSQNGELLVTYNMNTTRFSELNNIDIYRPRFLRIIQIKNDVE